MRINTLSILFFLLLCGVLTSQSINHFARGEIYTKFKDNLQAYWQNKQIIAPSHIREFGSFIDY